MLVAYLRGLLQPGYPQGIKSLIRENLILKSLNLELEAKELLSRTMVEASYAPLMQPNNANNLLKQHDKMLSLVANAQRNNMGKSNKLKNVDMHGIDKFIEAYKIFKKQGILDSNPDGSTN